MKTNNEETYDPFQYQQQGKKSGSKNPPKNNSGSNSGESYDPFQYQQGDKAEHRN